MGPVLGSFFSIQSHIFVGIVHRFTAKFFRKSIATFLNWTSLFSNVGIWFALLALHLEGNGAFNYAYRNHPREGPPPTFGII